MNRNQKPALSNKKVAGESESYEQRINVNFEEVSCTKIGYLSNMKPTTYTDPDGGGDLAAVLLYFVEANGNWFKAHFKYEPYFYIQCSEEVVQEVIFYLNKTYESVISKVDYVSKEDLDLINHLSGKTSKFLKLSFKNVQDLMTVKSELMPLIKRNQDDKETKEAYAGWYNPSDAVENKNQSSNNDSFLSKISEIREYDVPYHIRTCIDNEIRCSMWYELKLNSQLIEKMECLKSKLDKADLRVMAFDIETSKATLKFPDARFDQIMMISYVIDGKGFLITNRDIVGDDVKGFEYSPKPEYDIGHFTIFNEANEKALLDRFFEHIRETRPFIFSTFNGDYFDWPFIDERSKYYSMKLEEEIGIFVNSQGEYQGRFAVHMDCFYWVKRDAYLPQGSHGLKAVTKAKLGYDPVELDPELMVPYAREKPQELAEYSISDAVATYFLYQKMIHDFIFALCTIIPTNPDEVLRKGSGTLCEDLLMAQAFRGNIIFPNKQIEKFERFYKGHLIDNETYIGGHVECLRTGVYRSDIPVKFRLEKSGYQGLIDTVEQIMDFAIKIELNQEKENVLNYNEIRDDIIMKLGIIKSQCPVLEAEPLIYHVDVAAMYPNIILSNRLQPVAIVNEQVCAGCVFNKEENKCKRHLEWQWKGDYFPLSRKEYEGVKNQLEYEEEKGTDPHQHSKYQQNSTASNSVSNINLKAKVKKYCQNVYKQVHQSKVELKSDTVCMRENSFYVDTVRDFRDRRYDYKNLVKVWQGNFQEAMKNKDAIKTEEAKNRMNLFESLQLAHKIILNSFYGYVMRRGARWYSMEMAAMVTHTGGSIIMDSRALFDQIGIPLELDTDGIWTLLPKGFPEQFQFQMQSGKKINFSFPCTMCNVLIYDKYANKQYQTLIDKKRREYETKTEMSVFFEIDGPYRCMVIPASKEENKMLKKRYAVFTHSGKLQELKGFELKRRGELKIIKIFQQEVFEKFLEGKSLQECYDSCGEVAERWYDILETEGEYVDDSELIEYIGESRVLSKSIAEYGSRKATSITCAKRLAEFLGNEIVKDKGLCAKFIISKKPVDAKVADRAIPTVIFEEADENVQRKFLRRWLKDASHSDFNIRNIIDWDYYKERLAGTIQKIVTIPAALQKCLNPVPRIKYPDWLHKRLRDNDDKFKQKDMKFFFKNSTAAIKDIEELTPVSKQVVGPINRLSLNSDNKKSNAIKQDAMVQKYEKIEDCPQPEDDFSEWLKYQKHNWRKIRKTIKTDKKVIQNNNSFGNKSQGIIQFMKNMDESVINSTWHILQIDETFEPGLLKLWILTDNSTMFSVKLRVPRTIYINSKITSDSPDFKKVTKILPRTRKAYHLYEWEKNEDVFIEKFQSINYHHLMNHNVEGVYETKVPLIFKAILDLGCLVKPISKMIPRSEQALGRTYKREELEIKNQTVDFKYMPPNTYEKIYLLHSSSNHRHMWGLFTESMKDVQFFLVNPVNNKNQQQVKSATLKTIFTHSLTELDLQIEYADWDISNTQYFNDVNGCVKAIDLQLQQYKQKYKGQATIVILQSEFTPEKLLFMGMPSIMNDFPHLKCPQVQSDNDYPALDWIRLACKNMTHRFTEMPDWMKERINFSRYSHIPICNLGEGDAQLFIIDTLFARNLRMSKHLLWYSDTGKPDLGGHEDKDFRIYYQDELENPEISQKGFYRGYTVEIDVSMLAVNTILQSEFLKEFDEVFNQANQIQSDSNHTAFTKIQSSAQGEFDADLDEFATCAVAFKKLKDLVGLWLSDVMKDDAYADQLISHVYRWVSTPSKSKLYDPLLHRLIHKLMQKNFYQLLFKLKKLGCNVIYASFHKIYVHTDKQNYEESENYINFVIQTIKSDPMFAFLILTPSEYWRIMLFKDIYNFGGIRESNPQKVASSWDIQQHLPEAIQKKFSFFVGEFILKVYKFNLKLNSTDLIDMMENDLEKDDQFAHDEFKEGRIESLMDAMNDAKKERDYEFICTLINEHFSQKLFTLLSEIQMRKPLEELYHDEVVGSDDDQDDENEEENDYNEGNGENDGPGNGFNDQYGGGNNMYAQQRKQREQAKKRKELKKWEFPSKIGSHYEYKTPALEFAKFICNNVFALDEAFSRPSSILLKNLLKIVHAQEYSKETLQGNEPSLVLVVPDIICENCENCRDIDICRDSKINDENTTSNTNQYEQTYSLKGDWSCKVCTHQPNKSNIEKRLVDLLNRRVVGYQMQDLKCIKCKMVKNGMAGKYCECTGTYTQTIGNQDPEKLKNPNLLNSSTDIRLFLQLMRNFGIYHNMPILKDTSQQLLNLVHC